jgi:hypothetical protein
MAQVFVTFGRVDNQRGMPVYAPEGVDIELTSSGSAGATTPTTALGDYCRVRNNGSGTIWVAFGTAPTAAVNTSFAVGPNETRDWGPFPAGYKVSVIDDS